MNGRPSIAWTLRVVASCTGLALAAGTSGDARGDPWSLRLGAGTSGYDQRTVWVGSPQLAVRTLAPGFAFDSGPAAWNVRLAAERKFEFLDANSLFDSTAATPSQRRADFADLRVRHALSDQEFVALDGNYVSSPDLLDTERGPVVRSGEHTRWNTNASATVRLFEGALDRTHRADPGPATAAADVTAWNARLLPLRGSRTALLVGFEQRVLDLDGARALRTDRAGVGVRRELTPGVHAQVVVGGVRIFHPDGSTRERPDYAFRLESSSEKPSALSFGVEVQGDSLGDVRAELSHVLGIGRGFVRAERVADVDGSLFHSPTLDRRAVAGLQDTLGRANIVGAEASYELVRPLVAPDSAQVTILRTSLWFVRRIQPWLDARVAYALLREPGFGASATTPVLRRSRVDAELTFHAP